MGGLVYAWIPVFQAVVLEGLFILADSQGILEKRSRNDRDLFLSLESFMSLSGTAKETLSLLKEGRYQSKSGVEVQFANQQQTAVRNTRLYSPEQGAALLEQLAEPGSATVPILEVTDEKTQAAARRLVEEEHREDLLILNFASARSPGGGFLNGAKAQEEDLARCSGLYPCLLTQPDYYEENRAQESLLYTDFMIYSPRVPWFRNQKLELLDRIFLASVITAPAPNAGQLLRREGAAGLPAIEATLRRRARILLAVAQQNHHRNLLLGAWGCGVFQNDPMMVARAFQEALNAAQFAGWFLKVSFAVYDPTKPQRNLLSFKKVFG